MRVRVDVWGRQWQTTVQQSLPSKCCDVMLPHGSLMTQDPILWTLLLQKCFVANAEMFTIRFSKF